VLHCERVIEQLGAWGNDPGAAEIENRREGEHSHGCPGRLSSRRTLPSTCKMAP
jgi:hypothetical protein